MYVNDSFANYNFNNTPRKSRFHTEAQVPPGGWHPDFTERVQGVDGPVLGLPPPPPPPPKPKKNELVDIFETEYHAIAKMGKAVEHTTEKVVSSAFKGLEDIYTFVKDEAVKVEKAGEWVVDEVEAGSKWILHETEEIGEDIYDISKKLYHYGKKAFLWTEKNYSFIILLGGSYLAAMYVSKVKKALT